MIVKPLQGGETIELRHPLGGASPLDLTTKLRQIKLTAEEAALYTQVSQQKAELSSKAAAYSATKLRDELDEAKAAIAADEVTDEKLENVARLAALATDPAVAKAVEREAHAAIQPELARLDATLIPICERLITEVRVGLDKAAAKFNVGGLLDFIEDQHLGQLASYVGDRIAASHALLDAWTAKAASEGAEAFLRDDRMA
jgi:multidrug efflux pump subunit AcrA (membrane-fusion protein)